MWGTLFDSRPIFLSFIITVRTKDVARCLTLGRSFFPLLSQFGQKMWRTARAMQFAKLTELHKQRQHLVPEREQPTAFPPRPGQTRLTGTGSSSSERQVRTSTRLRSIPIVRSVCNQLEIYLFAQSNQRCMSNKLIQTSNANVTPEKLVSQGTKIT